MRGDNSLGLGDQRDEAVGKDKSEAVGALNYSSTDAAVATAISGKNSATMSA